MGEHVVRSGVAIITAFIMLAVLSVVLSKQANTTAVLTALGSLISNSLKAATGPVTGGGGSLPTLPTLGG